MSSIEIQKYPDAMAATARILNATGETWTFRTDGFEATNFGLLSGNLELQRKNSLRLPKKKLKRKNRPKRKRKSQSPRNWPIAEATC